jgi:hypothetical protein
MEHPRSSMSSLLSIAISIIFALLFPYILTYAISLGHKYRLIRLEPIESAQIPVEIMSLMQPWIDRLTTYDFKVVNYQLVYEGLVHQPPYWGITLQHSSQQTFAGLMVAPIPNIRYPVIATFSSYYQENNLTTVNIKDLSVRSKSTAQTMNHPRNTYFFSAIEESKIGNVYRSATLVIRWFFFVICPRFCFAVPVNSITVIYFSLIIP